MTIVFHGPVLSILRRENFTYDVVNREGGVEETGLSFKDAAEAVGKPDMSTLVEAIEVALAVGWDESFLLAQQSPEFREDTTLEEWKTHVTRALTRQARPLPEEPS